MNSSYSMRRRACIRKVTYNFLWVFGVGFGSVECSCVCSGRGEIASSVQHRTKKAGVGLTWVQFPHVAWDFSSRAGFQLRLLQWRTALVCNHMHKCLYAC